MSLITCENLTLGYEGKAILSGLNFSVNSGDYLCIVGENGSGKSTLMKTLLHLQSPMSGSIILGDDLKINEIGYLPQQTALQRDFPASVDEIVMSGFLGRMGLRPFYNKAEKKEAHELMEKTRITDLADRCYRIVRRAAAESASDQSFAPQGKSSFWMSLFLAWIRLQLRICTRLSTN